MLSSHTHGNTLGVIHNAALSVTSQVMANEFPYYLEPDVSHINIWCSSMALSDETVERLISERLPCDEYVWFVNPPQFQSVRTVRVLSRRAHHLAAI